MKLSKDLTELLAEFVAKRARFLLVGGHAVAVHIRRRATKDVDVELWVEPGPANLARAYRALLSFGVPNILASRLHLAEPDEIVWLGRPPSGFALVKTLVGVEFGTAWRRRIRVIVGGVKVPVIDRTALIASKRALGGPHDLRVVEWLQLREGARAAPRRSAKTRSA